MAVTPVRSLVLLVSLSFLALSGTAFRGPARRQGTTKPDLTVHEWGTFTSIADRTGHTVRWIPSSNSSDLPEFVEHYRTADYKARLQGTVRMDAGSLFLFTGGDHALGEGGIFKRSDYGVVSARQPRGARSSESLARRRFA